MKHIHIEIADNFHAEFKSESAKHGQTLKQAFKEAMKLWIDCKQNNFIVKEPDEDNPGTKIIVRETNNE